MKLLEELLHNQGALVLDQVLLYSFFLILAGLVHEAQHRVDAKLHRLRHVIAVRDL